MLFDSESRKKNMKPGTLVTELKPSWSNEKDLSLMRLHKNL